MSVRDKILAITRIIKKLKRGPATFKELSDYLQIECEINDFKFCFSLRTLQRDKHLIFSTFGVDIVYCKTLRKWKISDVDTMFMPPDGSSALVYII